MKLFLSILLFLNATVAIQAQTTFVQPVDGTDCSNLFFKAMLEEDNSVLNGLLATDFTVAGFQGQMMNGSQLTQAVANGYLVIESGMLSGTQTRIYGDVAIVTGQWNVRAKIENSSFQGDLSYMTVCVKSGGRYKVVALQFTPIR